MGAAVLPLRTVQHRALSGSRRPWLGLRVPPAMPHRERRSPNCTPGRETDLALPPRTLFDMIRNELSFLFSQFDLLSNRPNRHQVVGLEPQHFFNVSTRVGHTVFCLNLTHDVFD